MNNDLLLRFFIQKHPTDSYLWGVLPMDAQLLGNDEIARCHLNNDGQGRAGTVLRIFLPVLRPAGPMVDVHGGAFYR